jgi:hypothetical protein
MDTTPSKADHLLSSVRATSNVLLACMEDGRSDDAIIQARQLLMQFVLLDSHLSNGGSPPEAWSEGPDEPVMDEPVNVPDAEGWHAEQYLGTWWIKTDDEHGHRTVAGGFSSLASAERWMERNA